MQLTKSEFPNFYDKEIKKDISKQYKTELKNKRIYKIKENWTSVQNK